MVDKCIDIYEVQTKSKLINMINEEILKQNSVSLLINNYRELLESFNEDKFITISFLENNHHGTPYECTDIDRSFYRVISENPLEFISLKDEIITKKDEEYAPLNKKLREAKYPPI